jgi:GNAT superfamily N-acetyltransferase
MPDAMNIRSWHPNDHEEVWNLHRVALQATGAFIASESLDEDFNQIKGVYLDPGGCFLVYLFKNRIVGMGGLKRIDRTTAELRRMRVHPDFQGRGIGKCLLLALESEASTKFIRRIVLNTTHVQVAAQRLYQASGYRETHRSQGTGAASHLIMIYFEKELSGKDKTVSAAALLTE